MRSRSVYRGRIVALELLDDRFEVVRHAAAVAVLAEREDGQVLGVRQQRPAIDRTTWELPAGMIDAGETPAEAARRELREETGLDADLTLLTRMYVSPGFTDEEVHLFVAARLRPGAGTPDEGEVVHAEWRDPLTVWRQVAAGRLASSAPTLVGLRHLLALRGLQP